MNHVLEWQQSCVDEQLIALNVTALEGETAFQHLLYSENLPRRNDGRISQPLLKRYEHTESGGWWCSGIDVLTGENDLWGCFKPNNPRFNLDDRQLIKYEHPPKTPTGLFALRVPSHLREEIAERFGVNIVPQEDDFWQWVMDHPTVPLCITEGAKKAGALLTAGYAAIALPGIHNGYRTPKDAQGNRIGKSHLIPQLERFATQGREIYLIFDQDSKPSTIKAVNMAIRRMGYLLTQARCSVKVVTWKPHAGKGVDDFIANRGKTAFDEAYNRALPLETWKAQGLYRLTYSADICLNSAYLPSVEIPQTARLIGIKSPKGTGKTKLLESIVEKALARQQWVLVIGHRIKLVEELCQRFKLPYIQEIKDHKTQQTLGYGLCIDSLHPQSQAQFEARKWTDGVVIIDEVEQVLWHGLNSETCKYHRVAILKSLKILMQNVLGGKGQVYVADADLSDIALDYLIALAGIPLQPFIIENEWKPNREQAWTVYNYADNSPKRFVKDLVKHIREGGKPFVCLSAQKLTSQWGTCTLESYLQKQFPNAKILRIDSESLSNPHHPAYNCISRLNQLLKNYDIVLASPSIETGISIEIKGHFTSVWGLAQGVQTATSVCQALGRIRENIPRYLWAASYGFNTIGNGSTSIPDLLASGHRLTQLNIRLLQQSDLAGLDDLDTGFQAESLLAWAKMAVRVNVSLIRYRESILAILQEENHLIQESHSLKVTQKSSETQANAHSQLTEIINAVREQNYRADCTAIAQAHDLSEEEYVSLKKRLVKTPNQRHLLRKYELYKRYNVPITPQLVMLDDEGWYQKLRLHYYLTIGRSFLADRDAMMVRKLIDNGQGSLFLPDFNISQLGAMIGTMEVLGIPVLLNYPQRKLSSHDDDLKQMATLAIHNRTEIKTILKIGIAKTASPITIVRRLLETIGYKLVGVGTQKKETRRVRIYQIVLPKDGRETILKQWLERDQNCPGSSEPWYEKYLATLPLKTNSSPAISQPYRQLSLDL